MEILDDDHYQSVVDQQVNEQHLLLLLLVPYQHNIWPKEFNIKKNNELQRKEKFILEYFVLLLSFEIERL